MMLLSEFGRNQNTLTPLCNMKKTCIQEPRGKLEYTLKTIMQHEKKKSMSGVCSISPAVG